VKHGIITGKILVTGTGFALNETGVEDELCAFVLELVPDETDNDKKPHPGKKITGKKTEKDAPVCVQVF
jgi:hypothetical protein